MLLECEQLTMCYPCGTPALRGVDLTLAAGQRLAVIGANGAGKSTLLSALVGLVDVQGRVLVNGVPLTKETMSVTAESSETRETPETPLPSVAQPTIRIGT